MKDITAIYMCVENEASTERWAIKQRNNIAQLNQTENELSWGEAIQGNENDNEVNFKITTPNTKKKTNKRKRL